MVICKEFNFAAAHSLPLMPLGHKCRNLHGHTYRVELRLQGELDTRGIVADFADIEAAWRPLHAILDHHYLNDIEGLETPTAELVAVFILAAVIDALPLLHSVRVYESPTSWAEVLR
jgi:6-pyruvoyltetrahydropterin/6-carboxytetrahydropterin synthase